ncbi:MAG: S1 RNA-binding domain-containing protein [Promethearchaeota archaeon]
MPQKKKSRSPNQAKDQSNYDTETKVETFDTDEDYDSDAFPQKGELCLCTCTKVSSHGAYFSLSEYEHLGKEVGFIHISELSRTWIRNIKSHIREGQHVVAKVLRVDAPKNEIDMSVRRVTESQKRAKMQATKYEQHAKNLVRVAGEELKFDQEKQNEYRRMMSRVFGSVYDALTEARLNGADVLIEAGLPKEVAKILTRIAETRLEAPSVTLIGIATTEIDDPRGIELLRGSYLGISSKIPRGVQIKITSLSAPNYRIEIKAGDWKEAENAWKNTQDHLQKTLQSKATKLAFERV